MIKNKTLLFISLIFVISSQAQDDARNNWEKADSLINKKEYKKAAIVLESIFRSRNYAGYGYDAARYRALAGDKKECFLMLNECIDKGFNEFNIIKKDSAFVSLYKTKEWQQIKTRVKDSIDQWKKRIFEEFQQKCQGKIGVDEKSVELYSNSLDSIYSIYVSFNDFRINIDTIYPEPPYGYRDTKKCLFSKKIFSANSKSFDANLTGKTFNFESEEFYFLDKNRYIRIRHDEVPISTFKTTGIWKVFYLEHIPIIVLYYSNYNIYDGSPKHTIVDNLFFPISKDYIISGVDCIGEDSIHLLPYKSLLKTDKIAQNKAIIRTKTEGDKKGLETLLGDEILPAIYDSIYLSQIIGAFINNKIIFYDYDGIPISDTLKTFQFYGQIEADNLNVYQVIDKLNEMYFINSLGEKFNKAPSTRGLIGNDTDLSSYVSLTVLKEKKKLEIIEKQYDSTEPQEPVFSENPNPKFIYHQMPKEFNKIKFVNNQESIFHEDYWSDLGPLKNLEYILMIVKKKNKYGVVRFPDLEEVVPFIYNNISCHQTYLILEENGFKTYYPYDIGTKYKEFSEFTGYFARFGLPDGKTGWVDRSGNKYFDN
jgi:hypothetical protein